MPPLPTRTARLADASLEASLSTLSESRIETICGCPPSDDEISEELGEEPEQIQTISKEITDVELDIG
jgi:hypothetical protein